MTSARTLAILTTAGLLFNAPLLAQSLDAEVRLEGSGRHRERCNALHYKPFDASVFGDLTNWTGTPVTPESFKDKALLLVTWTSYAKSANNPAILLAQRLHTRHAEKGLVVVGIHNPKGFDSAKTIATDLGITFPFAADELGKARVALGADQDPDFFLVDRAGNMRFADIETSAVERAVEIVLGETVEQAVAVPTNVAMAITDKAREAMRTRGVKGAVTPGLPLTVPFEPPGEEAYNKARWPRFMTKTGFQEYDSIAERIEKDKPLMALNDEGWHTTPPVAAGRVQLIYTYDPLDTEIRQVADTMSRLQLAHARDLVVAGNLVKMKEDHRISETEKQRREQQRIDGAVRFMREAALNHGINTVPLQINGQDMDQAMIAKSRRELTVAFLIATDGHCRWMGNPYFAGFETVVQQFLDADPGVQARRKAEDAQAKLLGN